MSYEPFVAKSPLTSLPLRPGPFVGSPPARPVLHYFCGEIVLHIERLCLDGTIELVLPRFYGPETMEAFQHGIDHYVDEVVKYLEQLKAGEPVYGLADVK